MEVFMENLVLHTLEKDEISTAMKLVWEVFEKFELPDYTNEGIREFQNYITLPNILSLWKQNKLEIWGAFFENNMVGTIATNPTNHISLLFVHSQHHRKGIAKALFNLVKKNCSANHFQEITVNSSPYAVEIYHKLGFTDTNKEQTINGIRFTPMTCKI